MGNKKPQELLGLCTWIIWNPYRRFPSLWERATTQGAPETPLSGSTCEEVENRNTLSFLSAGAEGTICLMLYIHQSISTLFPAEIVYFKSPR